MWPFTNKELRKLKSEIDAINRRAADGESTLSDLLVVVENRENVYGHSDNVIFAILSQQDKRIRRLEEIENVAV